MLASLVLLALLAWAAIMLGLYCAHTLAAVRREDRQAAQRRAARDGAT